MDGSTSFDGFALPTCRARRDPAMISALRRAHALMARDAHGPILAMAPESQYARRLIALALLAPDIQRDLLAGRQPRQLSMDGRGRWMDNVFIERRWRSLKYECV